MFHYLPRFHRLINQAAFDPWAFAEGCPIFQVQIIAGLGRTVNPRVTVRSLNECPSGVQLGERSTVSS